MRWEVRTATGRFIALRYSWPSAQRCQVEFSNRWWERLIIIPLDWPDYPIDRLLEFPKFTDIGPWSD